MLRVPVKSGSHSGGGPLLCLGEVIDPCFADDARFDQGLVDRHCSCVEGRRSLRVLLEVQVDSAARVDAVVHVVCCGEAELYGTHLFQVNLLLLLLVSQLLLDRLVVDVLLDAVLQVLRLSDALSWPSLVLVLDVRVWGPRLTSDLRRGRKNRRRL